MRDETSGPLLIVDDEANTCDLIEAFLKSEGFEVHRGKDGIDAFSLIFSHPPSLMLIDMCLPCMTGLEVIEQVRGDRHTSSLPILAMSGDRALLEQALGAGANAVLSKPFGLQELRELIVRYVPPTTDQHREDP